jgi:hypothetical protein
MEMGCEMEGTSSTKHLKTNVLVGGVAELKFSLLLSSSSLSPSPPPVIPYGRQQNVAILSYLWPSTSPRSSSSLFLMPHCGPIFATSA